MLEQQSVPNVGEWYQSIYSDPFRVVAIDEDTETLDVQFVDGDVEELDFDSLKELHLRLIGPPEDWSRLFDDSLDNVDCTELLRQPTGLGIGDVLMDVERNEEWK